MAESPGFHATRGDSGHALSRPLTMDPVVMAHVDSVVAFRRLPSA